VLLIQVNIRKPAGKNKNTSLAIALNVVGCVFECFHALCGASADIPYQIPFAANNPQILRFIYRKVLFAKNVYQFGTCFENAYICTACIQWVALRKCKQV
jgi:hypothetical protein